MEKLQKSQMRLEEAQRIAHIGSWESNIQTNKSYATEEACRLLDATPDEVATFEGFLSRVHPEDRELVVKSIEEIMQGKGTTFNYEYRTILKDGSIRVIYAQGEVSFDSAGKPVKISGTAMDITERKHKDEQIKASLKEKEVLLREIHHRVKNNMQIISSLLAHQMESITDESVTGIFTESQNRIISMSLVHEKLYQSRDLRSIGFEEYINDLGANLFQSYNIQTGNVKLNINVENIFLDIDLAIPAGLIINELITNSLKYAFPGGMKGEISVTFRSAGENLLKLVVSDNGIGFPKDLDFRKTRSLGLHLVTILTENQLHGKINMNSNKGTEFQITFKG